MAVTHPFQSDVADGDDDSLVQPSDWNADHDVDIDAADVSIGDVGGDFTATDVEGALAELQSDHEADTTALTNHTSDTTEAHSASAISASSATLVGTGTDVQAVLEELDNGIADHMADTAAAHTAASVSADSTTLVGAGTDVQAVLEELDNGIADHLADTTAAHAASAISADSTALVGTGADAQAVFEELDNAIVATETVANNAATKNGGGKETYDAHGGAAVGATETIDLANGNVHRLILDENLTITLSGSTASVACSVTVILVQDGTGTNTVAWPGSVEWAGGVAPTISPAASAVDIVTLFTVDNGTTWYGFVAGQAFA